MIKKLYPIKKLPQKFSIYLKRNKKVIPLLTPFGSDLNPQRWIFIIGCYNSGTTLLDRILQAHPEIQGLPNEGVRLTDGLRRPEEFGWHRMWYKCIEHMSISENRAELIADRIKKHWSLWYDTKPPNYVEKSIANAVRIKFLNNHFHPAYFIYIVRNGYAVAEGIRRKSAPGEWGNVEYKNMYPIELCAKQWEFSDQVVEEQKENVDNFLKISYEDFAENTVNVMSQVTTFLGLPKLNPNMLNGKWEVHGYNSEIKNMNSISFERLSSKDIKRIKKVASKTLEKYNYSNL